MGRRYSGRAGFVVRVLTVDSQKPVGTGFLVDDTHLVTCAHVVNVALGRHERDQDQPVDVRIPVDFPILGDGDGAPVRLCRVARWLPPPRSGVTGDGEDVAGLVIVGEPAPTWAGPARMPEEVEFPPGCEVHVFGHPVSSPEHSGSWATARVRGRVGGGLLQVDSDPMSAVRLQAGYSGSPLVVSDAAGDAVVGMLAVASSRGDRRDAYGIPVDRLTRAWPEVLAGIPPCPYRGLRPFTSADESVFVGREDDTDQLADMVGGDVLTLVVGPSGIGKSSLVNAGLIPRWRAGGGVAVTVRPGPWGARPLDRVLGDVEAALRATTSLDAWSLDLDGAAGGLAAAVSRRAEALGLSVLIHVDQFEELLAGTPADERRALVDALLPTSRDTFHACRVVVTMRADFLPALLDLPGLGTRLRHRMLTLSPMSVTALERAVSEPASARGVVYEPGLAHQIAADASGSTGALPLMAFALTELWETQRERRLTFAHYREFGGVAGAVNRHAERTYDRFHRDGMADEVRSVVLALVRSRGGAAEAGSRAVPLKRFAGKAPLVEELCRSRLLVVETGQGDGEPLVRLAHESLVRAWSRFARWVDEDADFQRWLAAMEERAADDELLADSRLGPAEQWLAERRADIPTEIVALVERSRSVSRRRIAELERARADAVEAAARAERAAAVAEARRLAAASELALTTAARGGPVPLALATASLHASWTLEGDTALRRALKTAPLPIAQFPDPKTNGLAPARLLSSGSHLVLPVSTSEDGWTAADRRTRLFRIDHAERECDQVYDGRGDVRFGDDGRVAIREESGRVTVVDVATGAVLVDDRDDRPVVSCVVSTDGTRLAVVRGDQVAATDEKVVGNAAITVVDLTTGTSWRSPLAGDLRGHLTFNGDCTALATTQEWYDQNTHYKWMTRTTVHDLVRGQELAEVDHDGSAWNNVVFSPDRRLLVAGTNDVDSCGDAHSGGLEVFDLAANGTRLHRVHHYLPVQAVAFDPTGRWLAVALGDERKRQTPGAGLLVEPRTGREHRRLHHDYSVKFARFNADGSRVVFAGQRSARVFDVFSGDELLRADHGEALADIVFHPDGRRILTVVQDPRTPVRLFESRSVEVVRLDWTGWIRHVALSQDGRRAFASFSGGPGPDRKGETRVVDTMTGEVLGTVEHGPYAYPVQVTHDGARAALVDNEVVTVLDLHGERPRTTAFPPAGNQRVWVVRFTGNDQQVMIASNAHNGRFPHGEIHVADLVSGAVVSPVRVAGAVQDLNGDGALAAVITEYKDPPKTGVPQDPERLVIVGTADGVERFHFHARSSEAMGFAPDGDWVAAECERSLTVRRTSDGRVLWSTDLDIGDDWNLSTAVSVSPTGAHLAVVERPIVRQGTVTFLDARDGTRLARFAPAAAPAFSLDGRRAAVLVEGSALVVDLATGATLCVVEHELHVVDQVAFLGREGEYLITMDNRSLRVSHVDTKSLLAEADARITRDLTESERRRYLPGTFP